MTPEEVITRAKSGIGLNCKYVLGKGGRRPGAPFPWGESTAPRECDCSGFVAWCIGEDRMTDHPWYRDQNGGWLETTAIARDAETVGFGMFDKVPWAEAKPGMFVVYGDRVVDRIRRQGHVGIISAVDETGPTLVTHCSLGNYRRTTDAIQETAPTAWLARKDSLVARCALVNGDQE